MREGFVEALRAAGIPFDEDARGLAITIPFEKIDDYIELASNHIVSDAWNEVVGTRWVFIFSDGVWEWDSWESEKRILERCKRLETAVQQRRTLMEMLWNLVFYRDALYHDEYGTMINSEQFTGTKGENAYREVTDWLEKSGKGKAAINYRLRDWLISRQRYWGAPIPIVYCPEHGAVDVPEDQLPVLLPEDVEWLPTGESPLKLHPTWKYTTCPICGQPAERETDTMDTFMCSSWYHLRYLNPDYDQGPFDPEEYNYWMPVDTYTGGIEHATMHLIYTRFFHKACRDLGITEGHEPMIQLRNQGIILAEDTEKMSKSRGNVTAPDDLIARYGTDTIRAYLMFFARWEMGAPWNSAGIEGVSRWIRRVWSLMTETAASGNAPSEVLRSLRRKLHQILRQVTRDYEDFEFNTTISALMELLNEMVRAREMGAAGTAEWDEAVDIYVRMMAPATPHVAEEIWTEVLGKPYSVHTQSWPEFDEEAAREEQITLVVQVNGKVRDRILVPVDISQQDAQHAALNSPAVQKYLQGKQPRKVILVQGKLVNIVV
ncbi:MAG: class I tRNA ligase family protein [Anaerolineales bacterium]|nr:class I tRNA ligase family protein [Anaerolineales bacterium]